jgi:hypothetical protein
MDLLFAQTSVTVNIHDLFDLLKAGTSSGFGKGQYFTHKFNMLWPIFRFTFEPLSGNILISQKSS